MRAIVTGGAGFIGSHVADALIARGDEVWILDNFASGKLDNVPEEAVLVERDVREPLDELFEEVLPASAAQGASASATVRATFRKTMPRTPSAPRARSQHANWAPVAAVRWPADGAFAASVGDACVPRLAGRRRSCSGP